MTIKTQDGKIITKDGKVSCECCDVECCMYPAAALVASLYSYEDLPDAIDVGGIEYAKLDPPESVAGFTEYYINVNDEYLGILEGEGENSLWGYEGGGGPCLINGHAEFNPDGERRDQFADTYTISGPISGTVTRESICVWRGSNLRLTNFGYQWKVNGNNKTGNQNTPVGSYAGGYSVS